MLTLYEMLSCRMMLILEGLSARGQEVSPRSGLVVDHLWATVFFSLFCRTSRRQHKNNVITKNATT